MKTQAFPLDMEELNGKLRQWQKRHDMPAKVAKAHSKALLDRMIQSMAFENEPVSLARLKSLLRKRTAQKQRSKSE